MKYRSCVVNVHLKCFKSVVDLALGDEEKERDIPETHYVELSNCPCDLTPDACDINCCCDDGDNVGIIVFSSGLTYLAVTSNIRKMYVK